MTDKISWYVGFDWASSKPPCLLDAEGKRFCASAM